MPMCETCPARTHLAALTPESFSGPTANEKVRVNCMTLVEALLELGSCDGDEPEELTVYENGGRDINCNNEYAQEIDTVTESLGVLPILTLDTIPSAD